MPRIPLATLKWSQDGFSYKLSVSGQEPQLLTPEDRTVWQSWLETHDSFAFQGQRGRLNVYKEARSRGGQYWYAYHTASQRTRKRYLGHAENVTFHHLEEIAEALSRVEWLAPEKQVSSRLARQPLWSQEILATKLTPPRLPAHRVERERLYTELQQVFATPCFLVSAPAGSGKTTLLAAWAARNSSPTRVIAWLSLDVLDNDSTRFWTALIAALRTRLPEFGEEALQMLHSAQLPPLAAMLSALFNEVAGRSEEIALVLDDFHVLEDQGVYASLQFALEHLPTNLHLVLAGRTEPAIPLARLRTQGLVKELGYSALRFHNAEVASFLNGAFQLALADAEVRALEQHTEGWVAGLQIAAMSMQQHDDPAAFVRSFHGGYRFLQDYMQEEFLVRLPEDVRAFVLQTAILTRLTAALCQAVTDQAASQAWLEWLERSNLFLIPLDEERRWYRWHDLVREALLARLQTEYPERVPLLHQRAATFYEAGGEWVEAIEHRLKARDFSTAVALMARVSEELWLRGEAQMISCWVRVLPDEVLGAYPHFVLTTVLYLLSSFAAIIDEQQWRMRQKAEEILSRVETALSHSADRSAEDEQLLSRRLQLLRLWCTLSDVQLRNDRRLFESLDQDVLQVDERDEILWQIAPLAVLFHVHHTFRKESGLLVPQLEAMKLRAQQAHHRYATLKALQWLALATFRAGQFQRSVDVCQEALKLIAQSPGYDIMAGYFSIYLCYVYYERNQLQEVSAICQRVLKEATVWQQLDLYVATVHQLAQVEFALGNLEGARQILQESEAFLAKANWYRPFSSSWVTTFQVQDWLASGDYASAFAWAERVRATQSFQTEAWSALRVEEFVMFIRVHFAQKQYQQVVEILTSFQEVLDRAGNMYDTLSFLAVFFVALVHAGQLEQARPIAARLLALTRAEGFVRIYLDEGEPMRRALAALLETPDERFPAISASYVSQLLAAFASEDRQRSGEHASFSAKASSVEPLTAREREVLSLLADGATNQSLAQRLVISQATVKKHVSNILSKLGAANRTQAIARARMLGLL